MVLANFRQHTYAQRERDAVSLNINTPFDKLVLIHISLVVGDVLSKAQIQRNSQLLLKISTKMLELCCVTFSG